MDGTAKRRQAPARQGEAEERARYRRLRAASGGRNTLFTTAWRKCRPAVTGNDGAAPVQPLRKNHAPTAHGSAVA